MTRNALILNNVISFVELADTDLVYGPASEPPEFDFICEADWKNLLEIRRKPITSRLLG